MRMKLFCDFSHGQQMVHGAGLCRLSLALHAACNMSPNVRRSNSGQHAGHVELRSMPTVEACTAQDLPDFNTISAILLTTTFTQI